MINFFKETFCLKPEEEEKRQRADTIGTISLGLLLLTDNSLGS